MTKEGSQAVFEAIEFLKNQERIVEKQRWSNRMLECSKNHAIDLGDKGVISHSSGRDNLRTKDRLKQYGGIVGCYGENISVFCKTAKEVMIQLLIDDGNKSRGHRTNIFKTDFKVLSCFSGPHKEYENVTVINYAAGFVEQGAEDPI